VPFAGVGQQFLDAAEVLPHGTPEARLGLALGEIAGGLFTAASGLAGEVGGGALSLTGVGALAGVPVIVASTTAVVGGVGNVMVGIQGLATTGAGPGHKVTGADLEKKRAEFENKVRPQFWKNEAATNPGGYSPENLELMREGKAPYGPDGRRLEVHHMKPLSEGGTNDVGNLKIMTRTEHRLGPNFKANHPRRQ
jgi:hypothetical protein